MIDQDQVLKYLKGNLRQRAKTFKSSRERRDAKQIRERRKFGVVANLGYSKYALVRKSVVDAGFCVKDDEDLSDAFLIWTDNFLPFEKIMNLKPYQRINHFPGMVEICRKDFLAKNFMRMNRLEPTEYSFVPKTWVLPQEHGFLLNYIKRAINRDARPTFIMKPANGAMGHGIRMFRAGDHIPPNALNGSPCVVQEYITNPLLIDGYKCDLRVYVLVTSCDPLRIFIYNEGLVRLGTEKYVPPSEPNGESVYMHLTNYAVNKRNADYDNSPDETDGSKRSFAFLDQYLRQTLQMDPNTVWRNIRDLIVKTIAIAAPQLLHCYRMCRHGRPPGQRTLNMDPLGGAIPLTVGLDRQRIRSGSNDSTKSTASEVRKPAWVPLRNRDKSATFVRSNFFEILGFDILLDSDLKPWLLEVNRSPSFNGDQELDRRVKRGLLVDTLRLLNIRPVDKENCEKEQKLHVFKRLYNSGHSVSCSLPNSASEEGQSLKGSKKPVKKSVKTKPFHLPPKNKNLDREFDRLRTQLTNVRRRLAQEFFEYHNCGDWCLIFPTDDPVSQRRFASFILANFEIFHKGKWAELQRELEDTYLQPVTEDEVLDKLNELSKRKNISPMDPLNDPYNDGMWSSEMDTLQVDDYQVSSSDDSSCGLLPCSVTGLTTPSSITKAGDVTESSTPSRECDRPVPLKHLTSSAVPQQYEEEENFVNRKPFGRFIEGACPLSRK